MSKFQRVSESGHVSMLGYPGKLVPHLLTLQSPFTLLPQISLLDAGNMLPICSANKIKMCVRTFYCQSVRFAWENG